MNFLDLINPFSKKFAKNQRFDDDINNQLQKNGVGFSDVEYDVAAMGMKSPDVGAGDSYMNKQNINFSQIFSNKTQRIAKYREMTYYPEISEALDIVADESIVQDSEGKIAQLNILKEVPKKIYNAFLKEFD
jgi:hypothetical protein